MMVEDNQTGEIIDEISGLYIGEKFRHTYPYSNKEWDRTVEESDEQWDHIEEDMKG